MEDYVKKMKPGQQKIYFVFGPTKAQALNSPFMEPFKSAGSEAPPVLILTNNVDEICFTQIGQYKNFSFTNIESAYEEISKDLGQSA